LGKIVVATAEHLERIDKRLSGVETHVESLCTRVGGLEQKVTALDGKVIGLERTVSRKFAAMGAGYRMMSEQLSDS
jgi:hypothetical protein